MKGCTATNIKVTNGLLLDAAANTDFAVEGDATLTSTDSESVATEEKRKQRQRRV